MIMEAAKSQICRPNIPVSLKAGSCCRTTGKSLEAVRQDNLLSQETFWLPTDWNKAHPPWGGALLYSIW